MTNLLRLQKRLGSIGVDAIIVSSELSQRYLSDFAYTDGYIFVSESEAVLLADFRYFEAARATVEGFDIREPQGTMLGELYRIILKGGYENIAVEERALTLSQFDKMSAEMPKINLLRGGSALIESLRRKKSEAEMSAIAEAQRITDAAYEHILSFISPDVTEIDVAVELEFFMRKMGAEGLAFDTIAVSGSASSLPHGVPRNKKLERGFLTMDFGAKYRGYCSDMTRTVVIGKADGEMKKLYNTVLSAQLAALDFVKEGILCRDADAVARDVIHGAGYEGRFGHSLGHGVGLYIHEEPRLSSHAGEDRLWVGDIVTVEPGIYIEGRYGCRIEDMVAVTEDGILNFTKSPKELIEI